MTHECKNKDFVNNLYNETDGNCNIFEWSFGKHFNLECVKYQIKDSHVEDSLFFSHVWKLTCNEYGCPIKYCPWCGEELPLENSQS